RRAPARQAAGGRHAPPVGRPARAEPTARPPGPRGVRRHDRSRRRRPGAPRARAPRPRRDAGRPGGAVRPAALYDVGDVRRRPRAPARALSHLYDRQRRRRAASRRRGSARVPAGPRHVRDGGGSVMTYVDVRLPAVAGRFYPGDAAVLARDVAKYLGTPAPAPRLGLVAPHAGYMYSGGVAGKTFRLARIPPLVVILAPNHTGRGARVSVLAARALRIPGRDVPVSSELSQRILREVPGATLDVRAHEREHAAEVEVPFLVALRPDVEILPIVLGGLGGD